MTKYNKTYNSYSGADIVASIEFGPEDDRKNLIIGELQTISYSIHREVSPVRTLGRANPTGFTSGQRTIAGSLIFTVFDRNLVYSIINELLETNPELLNSGEGKNINESYVVMDEMPPFDITITFNNEYGQNSYLRIKGIVIVNEGQVMSIEDMITENTMSYMATDIEVMKPYGYEYPGGASEVVPGILGVMDSSLPVIEPPISSMDSGTYDEPVYIELSSQTIGADVHYELESPEEPTSVIPTVHSLKWLKGENIRFKNSVIIKAVSIKNGLESEVKSFTYTIAVATPSISVDPGEYHKELEIALSTKTDSGRIYYTIDGTEPNELSPVYTKPFSIRTSTTVQAVTIKNGKTSEKLIADYQITRILHGEPDATYTSVTLAELHANEITYLNSSIRVIGDATTIINPDDRKVGIVKESTIDGTHRAILHSNKDIEPGLVEIYGEFKGLVKVPVDGTELIAAKIVV